MSSFDIAFDRLIGNEGGYSNNPSDPGKETMWGVTIAVARANGYLGQMKDMQRETAKNIYYRIYWLAVAADLMPFAIGFQVFDAAVNHGVQEAGKLLQGAVGAPVDGDVGPKTQAALRSFDPSVVILKFNAARLRFYGGLPFFSEFGRGWATNRTPANLDYAATDLSTT